MNLDNASNAFHVFELFLWAIAWCYFLPRPVARRLFLGAWGLFLASVAVALVGRVTSLALPPQTESFFFCVAMSFALGATMGFSSRRRRDTADATGNTIKARDEYARHDHF